MDLDVRLHRAFDRVELVGGSIGNPGEGRMCLMSLVAFLAGEAHSDAPRCTSPLIQTFAVLINDHMPREARQRLKPFAPRIIGTNDGFDPVRAEILRQALAEGILAKAPGQCPTGARTRMRKALAPSAPLAVAPQGPTRPAARPCPVPQQRRQPRKGGGAPDRTVGAPRSVWPRAGTAVGRGYRVAGPVVRSTRAAARAGHTGRAPGAAREHAPSGPAHAPGREGGEVRAVPPLLTRIAKLGGSGAIEDGPLFSARAAAGTGAQRPRCRAAP